jgi:anti-sigma factor RsiW
MIRYRLAGGHGANRAEWLGKPDSKLVFGRIPRSWGVLGLLVAAAIAAGAVWGMRQGFEDEELFAVRARTESFGHQAAAAHILFSKSPPEALQTASMDQLSKEVSNILGVPVHLHDPANAGYALLHAWVLPSVQGKAVQMAFRDAKDGKTITLYFEGRPGEPDTPFRAVPNSPVPTVAWQDDGLACAISGLADTPHLQSVGRTIYDALLS